MEAKVSLRYGRLLRVEVALLYQTLPRTYCGGKSYPGVNFDIGLVMEKE